MKKFLSAMSVCVLAGSFCWPSPAGATSPQAHLILVKTHRGQRHRPHKATKHHAPKRRHRSV